MGFFSDITGGSLLNGIIGVGSQLLANNAAKNQQAREQEWSAEQAQINRDYQTSEREAAQQWNLEQWNRENEYNSPAAQMQRAVEAGMNPNMLYGSSTGSVASSGQARTTGQSGSQAALPGSIAGSMLTSIAGSVNSYWQNESLRAQTRGADIDNETKGQRNEAEIRAIEEGIQKTMAEKLNIDQNTHNLKETAKNIAKLDEAQLGVLRVTLTKANEEIENLKKQREVMDKEMEEMDANIGLAEAHTTNVSEDTENKKKEGKILDEDLVIKQLESSLAEQGIPLGQDSVTMLVSYMLSGGDVSKILDKITDFVDPNGETTDSFEDIVDRYKANKAKRRHERQFTVGPDGNEYPRVIFDFGHDFDVIEQGAYKNWLAGKYSFEQLPKDVQEFILTYQDMMIGGHSTINPTH